VPGEPEPVIVTMKVPGDEDVQVNMEVPVLFAVRVTLGDENALQFRPAGSGMSDNATLPAKFSTLVNVIVDMADEPAFTNEGDVAEIVKSPTCEMKLVE
jgi:hypothetical protein